MYLLNLQMPKKFLLILLFLFISFEQFGQTLQVKFGVAQTGTTSTYKFGRFAKSDNQGNTYHASLFRGSVYLDFGFSVKTYTSAGLDDILISKYDSVGRLLFSFPLGSQGAEDVNAIEVDGDNNVYVSGMLGGKIDFDPSSAVQEHSPSYSSAMFLSKYSSIGDLIWTKVFYKGVGIIKSIIVKNQDLYICGAIDSETDFDFSSNIASIYNVFADLCFVAKYDTAVNFYWVKSMYRGTIPAYLASWGSHYAPHLELGTNNELFMAFSFQGGLAVDSVLSWAKKDYGNSGIAIVKLDTAGRAFWLKTARSSGAYPLVTDIGIDNNNNIYITGSFTDSIDFETSHDTINFQQNEKARKVFTVKYDSSGNFIWVNSINAEQTYSSFCMPLSLAIDNNAGIYITGYFEGYPTLVSKTAIIRIDKRASMFIVQYDSSGNVLYPNFFHDTTTVGSGHGYYLSYNKRENSMVFTGDFIGKPNFGYPPIQFILDGGVHPGAGGSSIFLIKYLLCPKLDTASAKIIATPDGGICTEQVVNFNVVGNNLGNNPTFTWKKNGLVVAIGKQIYSDSNLVNNDSISCEITSSLSCLVQQKIVTSPIKMTVHNYKNRFRDTVICNDDEAVLNSSFSNTRYFWNTGDTNSSIKVSNSGYYWTKIVKDNCEVFDSLRVEFKKLNFSLGIDSSICKGDSIELAPTINNGNYLWSTGDTVRKIMVKESGVYKLNVSDGVCSFSDSVTIQTLSYPVFDIGNDTSICKNESLTISIKPLPIPEYKILWSTGDTIEYINTNNDGEYFVSVFNKSCSSTRKIKVSLLSLPELTLPFSQELCEPDTVILTAGSTINKYVWSTQDTTASISVYKPGTYFVTVKNDNCEVKDSVFVKDCSDQDIYIPSSFSPNNDFLNDTFVVLIPPDNIGSIRIFNRWGQVLFKGENIRDIILWDATYNGVVLTNGLYYYNIIIKGKKIKAYSGSIMILH